MKRHVNKSVEITINPKKDHIEIGPESLHITTESGVRVELPYERAEIGKEDKRISFEKVVDSFSMKKKEI